MSADGAWRALSGALGAALVEAEHGEGATGDIDDVCWYAHDTMELTLDAL